MQLSTEQIETIREKHPDFDFEKFVLWHRAIQEELRKPKCPDFTVQNCSIGRHWEIGDGC